MMHKKNILAPCFCLLVVLLPALMPDFAQAEDAGKWVSSIKESRSLLVWSSNVKLLGSTKPVKVEFSCDPLSTKDMFGTLGIDITISNADKLKSFGLREMEGPDATVIPRVHATVKSKNVTAQTFNAPGSGSFSNSKSFTFGVHGMSKDKSVPRNILSALAEDGLESLQLTIINPKKPKLLLEFNIPVAGRQADFKKLLKNLK